MGDKNGADRRYRAVGSRLLRTGEPLKDSTGEKLPLKHAALRLGRAEQIYRGLLVCPFQADICDKKR
jgi:hypothetical protein